MGTQLQPVDILAPGQNLTAYIQVVNGFSILSAEEEKALAEDLYYRNNLDAARRLVMAHLRFVVHVAKSYSGYGLAQGDLIQEGNVGLMKAVKRFNPEKGVRLISFAVHWIKAEIHEFILRNWRIVKIATTKAQRKLFFNLRGQKKHLGWLSRAEAEAVAKDLNVDVKHVHDMEGRLAAYDAGFDAGVDDDDDTAYLAPANYLEDRRFDPAVLLENSDWEDTSVSNLESALEKLDDRSRDILQKRWLNEEKATLHELAAEYGVSAERIRQLEKNAMKKVRGMIEA
jgi:RNA polymerase sigma-32 factor